MSSNQVQSSPFKSSQVEGKPKPKPEEQLATQNKPSPRDSPSSQPGKVANLKSSVPVMNETDEKYDRDAAAAAKAISKNIPRHPYIPSIPSEKPYNLQPQHFGAWRRGVEGLFRQDEENLQYQTFLYHDPLNTLLHLNTTEEIEAMGRPQAAKPHSASPIVPAKRGADTSAENQAPKKKITLEAYKNRANTSQTGTPARQLKDDTRQDTEVKKEVKEPAAKAEGSKPKSSAKNEASNGLKENVLDGAAPLTETETKQAPSSFSAAAVQQSSKKENGQNNATAAEKSPPVPTAIIVDPPADGKSKSNEKKPAEGDPSSLKRKRPESDLPAESEHSQKKKLPSWMPWDNTSSAKARATVPPWLRKPLQRSPSHILRSPLPSTGSKPKPQSTTQPIKVEKTAPVPATSNSKLPNSNSTSAITKEAKPKRIDAAASASLSEAPKASVTGEQTGQTKKQSPTGAGPAAKIVKLRVKNKVEFQRLIKRLNRNHLSTPSKPIGTAHTSPLQDRSGSQKPPETGPDWKGEATRLHSLARELKQKATKHLQTSKESSEPNSVSSKMGTVLALESVLCFAQCFAARRMYSSKTQCLDWLSLCEFANGFRDDLKKSSHLLSLLELVLSAAYSSAGDAYGQTKEKDMNEEIRQSKFKDQPELFARIIRSSQTKAMQAAASANKLLSRAAIDKSYPKLKAFCEAGPLVLTASPMGVVRFGSALLQDWAKKMELKWTMQLDEGMCAELV